MQHRMVLANGRTGNVYELLLRARAEGWSARWRTLDGSGEPIEGTTGTLEAREAEEAFRQARDRIEEADEDVIGADWDFERPLPPWMD